MSAATQRCVKFLSFITEKETMKVPNGLQPQNIGVYPQERSETQLPSVRQGTSADKRWVSLGLWLM